MQDIDYVKKGNIMAVLFSDYRNYNAGIRSVYKGVPIALYDGNKKFFDYTRFYVKYRGPRKGNYYNTAKCNAVKVDIYEKNYQSIQRNRLEREEYINYCQSN
jgi:hypothetical protein